MWFSLRNLCNSRSDSPLLSCFCAPSIPGLCDHRVRSINRTYTLVLFEEIFTRNYVLCFVSHTTDQRQELCTGVPRRELKALRKGR